MRRGAGPVALALGSLALESGHVALNAGAQHRLFPAGLQALELGQNLQGLTLHRLPLSLVVLFRHLAHVAVELELDDAGVEGLFALRQLQVKAASSADRICDTLAA